MKDDFDRATVRVRRSMRAILKDGVLPIVAADAAITQALSLWAADTGRQEDAYALLRAWVTVRDA